MCEQRAYGTHLHVSDEAARPQWLEDKIRKAQHGQVLDELFTEIMVDAKDLLLRQILLEVPVKLAVAFQVFTERLFDNDPRPAAPTSVSTTVCLPHTPSALHLDHFGLHQPYIVLNMFPSTWFDPA